MLTRRQLLAGVAAAPLLSRPAGSDIRCPAVEFLEEPHLLAAESVRGYRAVANRTGWIIAPGIRDMTPEICASLLKCVRSGTWLLLESGICFAPREHAKKQLKILKHGFGLDIDPPVDANSYVSYSWPVKSMARPFHALTPVVCRSQEVIATYGGLPVCMQRKIGGGGIVYLGSMLGPGLMAEEREARQIGRALLHA